MSAYQTRTHNIGLNALLLGSGSTGTYRQAGIHSYIDGLLSQLKNKDQRFSYKAFVCLGNANKYDGLAAYQAPNAVDTWPVPHLPCLEHHLVEARESARRAKATLFYIQAMDVFANFKAPTDTTATDIFHALLRVPNLTKTKRLPAFCLLHVGMEVRLTTMLQMPCAVQDATATVLEIQCAEGDAQAHELEPEILLDFLPVAVLVKLHDCEHVFLPVHKMNGNKQS